MAVNENPIEEGPVGGIEFRLIPVDENGQAVQEPPPFLPAFYPDRFNQTSKKELRREGQQCRGEDVSIKSFNNAEFHATGVVLEENVRVLQELYNYNGEVDMMVPIAPTGGLRTYIKKGEVGELHGWNPGTGDIEPQWMFNYTIDLVSTGKDQFGNDSKNDLVSTQLEN